MSTEQASLDDKQVYVSKSVSRGSNAYHTDSECRYISEAHRTIPLPRAKDRDLRGCLYCSGEIDHSNPEPSEQCGAPTTRDHPCRLPALAGIGRCGRHLNVGTTDEGSDE